MPTWVTHFMVADQVLKKEPRLNRRGFCVGTVAPDCYTGKDVQSTFAFSQEIMHWKRKEKQGTPGWELFYEECLLKRMKEPASEEYAFLLGYYGHLLVDGAYQKMIRDEGRLRTVWSRIQADPGLKALTEGKPADLDTIKKCICKKQREQEVYAMEAEYLLAHPDSGYLTEVLPLRDFPDYLDYLPTGSILRRIGLVGYIPRADEKLREHLFISREEYLTFVRQAVRTVERELKAKALL